MQPPITASTSSILPSATVSREAEVLALLNQVGRMEVFKCGMERIYVLLGLMEFDDGAFRTLVRSWAAQKNVGAWIRLSRDRIHKNLAKWGPHLFALERIGVLLQGGIPVLPPALAFSFTDRLHHDPPIPSELYAPLGLTQELVDTYRISTRAVHLSRHLLEACWYVGQDVRLRKHLFKDDVNGFFPAHFRFPDLLQCVARRASIVPASAHSLALRLLGHMRPTLCQWVGDAVRNRAADARLWRTGVVVYPLAPFGRLLTVSIGLAIEVTGGQVEVQVEKVHPLCDARSVLPAAELYCLLRKCKSAADWCREVSAAQLLPRPQGRPRQPTDAPPRQRRLQTRQAASADGTKLPPTSKQL